MREILYADLGLIGYSECLDLQMEILEQRFKGNITDIVLLLEHNPVITMGRSGGEDALLVTPEHLVQEGIEIFNTDRGGNITYHGPGQLVGYPIFDLNGYGKDVHQLLRNLEEVVIQTIGEFGVCGETIKGLTGVWVNGDKICSIGVGAKKWISYHGFAFNVNPNLNHWALLHPCGLIGKQVASLKQLVDPCPTMDVVKSATIRSIEQVFDAKLKQLPLADLMNILNRNKF